MAEHPKHTKQEWASLFQQGEEKAFDFFFLELYAPLSFYAHSIIQNRELAEEIASDAFVTTWKMHAKLDSYSAIRAYLYKTVYHAALYEKHRIERRDQIETNAATAEPLIDTLFDHVVKMETCRLLHAAVKELAPGARKVITMYYFEGKKTGQIAKELKLAASTIKAQKWQGLTALKKRCGPILSTLYNEIKSL